MKYFSIIFINLFVVLVTLKCVGVMSVTWPLWVVGILMCWPALLVVVCFVSVMVLCAFGGIAMFFILLFGGG